MGELTWGRTTTEQWDYTVGGYDSKKQSSSVQGSKVIPANSVCSVQAKGSEMRIDIPYKATATTRYIDGGRGGPTAIEGYYDGIDVNQFDIVFGSCTPIKD